MNLTYPRLARMNYNELKIRILSLFESKQELDSLRIRELLATERTLKLTDKAVEMALLRYWRQGLLSRTRRAGRFQYYLTERGAARRQWLVNNQ
jgi:predicted DNA-binding transcriptional regulator